MKSNNPNPPAAPNLEMVVARQMAKTTASLIKIGDPCGLLSHKPRHILHPVEARLVRIESNLQDELSDKQQMQADAEAAGLANRAAWLTWTVRLIKVKIWCHGFRPPKQTKHPPQAQECPFAARLHLGWIKLLEILRLSQTPCLNIHAYSMGPNEPSSPAAGGGKGGAQPKGTNEK